MASLICKPKGGKNVIRSTKLIRFGLNSKHFLKITCVSVHKVLDAAFSNSGRQMKLAMNSTMNSNKQYVCIEKF